MAGNKPIPLFGNPEHLKNMEFPKYLSVAQKRDVEQALNFLVCYSNNQATFNSYRRDS